MAIGCIEALPQKSKMGSRVNCGGPVTVMVSEKPVESHLLITCKLTTYCPGLLIINVGCTELESVPFVKFHEEG